MDDADWRKRLLDAFGDDGVVGLDLTSGMMQEQAYKEYILNTFQDYDILTTCFFSLYLDTLAIATRQLHEEESLKDDQAYRTVHLTHIANF